MVVLNNVAADTNAGERFPCAVCSKSYLRKRHLQRHMRDECIGIPPRFSCELCPSRFRRKYHMVRHLTSKHNIPPNIAQHATGSGIRSNNTGNSNNNNSQNNSNNNKKIKEEQTNNETANATGMVENLSLRKDLFIDHGVNNSNGNASASPAHSAVTCSSSGTRSPMPAHLPTYGLSGAITALSSVAAAALIADPMVTVPTTVVETANMQTVAETAGGVTIKTEPMSPTKVVVDNEKMDDDWKIKLSLQLISNSLLKERLMNTIPFGAGYNNNNN